MSDCLFCQIVLGKVPSDVVYQDADTMAFRDIQPQSPVHVLVIPRLHVSNLADALEIDPAIPTHLARAAALVAEQEGISEGGYRCVVNNGPDAQQSVRHLHLHVLGGRQMGWPPG